MLDNLLAEFHGKSKYNIADSAVLRKANWKSKKITVVIEQPWSDGRVIAAGGWMETVCRELNIIAIIDQYPQYRVSHSDTKVLVRGDYLRVTGKLIPQE